VILEIAGLILLGLLAGTVAASLGVGGGIIYVPALVVLFAFDQHIAQGTSLAIILPTAIVATIAHARLGNVRWPLAAPIAIAGIAGAALGAWIALSLDADLLRRLFGVFLLLMAARMGWRAYQLNVRSAPEPDPS
jgi:uncharacterized membrane protein YfcA